MFLLILLFNDVTVRNFRFSFKFTPRNPKEAQQVKLIIRAFKRNMAPQAQGGISGSGNFFLRAPNVFKLRYRSGNKDHPFLNKFKHTYTMDPTNNEFRLFSNHVVLYITFSQAQSH